MEVKIYEIMSHEICDRWQVFINGHSWSMSDNANRPNGVCMTSDMTERELKSIWHNKVRYPRCVPYGVAVQVAYLVGTYGELLDEEQEHEHA